MIWSFCYPFVPFVFSLPQCFKCSVVVMEITIWLVFTYLCACVCVWLFSLHALIGELVFCGLFPFSSDTIFFGQVELVSSILIPLQCGETQITGALMIRNWYSWYAVLLSVDSTKKRYWTERNENAIWNENEESMRSVKDRTIGIKQIEWKICIGNLLLWFMVRRQLNNFNRSFDLGKYSQN